MFRKGKTGRQRILTRRAEGGRREWGRKLDLKRPFSVSSLTQNNPFVFFYLFWTMKKKTFLSFHFFLSRNNTIWNAKNIMNIDLILCSRRRREKDELPNIFLSFFTKIRLSEKTDGRTNSWIVGIRERVTKWDRSNN